MDDLDDLEMDMMSHRHDSDHPMSYLYEHDGGYRGAVRRCPGNGGRVACKHCGNNRLRWKFTVKGWRTFEGGVLHKCPAFSGKAKISPANSQPNKSWNKTMNKIETHDTMNPEQQDIAIFESLGWKYLPPVKRDSSFIVRPENLPRWKKGREIAYKGDIPSYGTDLNACHEFEKSLPSSLTQKYWWSLCDVTGLDQYEACRDPLLTVSATAPQRREAFLRTLNLWKL